MAIRINPNKILSKYIMDEDDNGKKEYYYRVKDAVRDEYVILTPVDDIHQAHLKFSNRGNEKKSTVGTGLTKKLDTKFRQLKITAYTKVEVDVSKHTKKPDLILLFGKKAPVKTDQVPYISFDPDQSSPIDDKDFDNFFV